MSDPRMNVQETALQFDCQGDTLLGILSASDKAGTRGLLIVVGGPQYRAGSHRQFTLLARALAGGGVPVMRFDYRGMGDSQGAPRSFDSVDDDLRAAIDCFFRARPTLESVVIWGLCDGACAALFHAPNDARVSGLVLLNPWVRTERGQARAQLKHYYKARLMEPDFWRKVLRGRFSYARAARSLLATVATVARSHRSQSGVPGPTAVSGDIVAHAANAANAVSLPNRMRESFGRFRGHVLIITSGRDMTAKEFLETVAGSRDWQRMLRSPRVTMHDLPPADHTFSRRQWRDQVEAWTYAWMKGW